MNKRAHRGELNIDTSLIMQNQSEKIDFTKQIFNNAKLVTEDNFGVRSSV